jgi:hypothetical protein
VCGVCMLCGVCIIRSPQMLCKTVIELHAVLRAAPPCWKNPYSLSWSLKFSQNVASICPIYILEFILSVRKVGLAILFALLAHYTENVMSCNGASYNSRELCLCTDRCMLRYVKCVYVLTSVCYVKCVYVLTSVCYVKCLRGCLGKTCPFYKISY